jgi:hypothetical protein
MLTDAELIRYPSGATRSADAEQARYDLCSPVALQAYAERMGMGVPTHGERNWEKGLPVSVFIRHGMRHLVLWLMGDKSDDHLAAWLWNAAGAVHVERTRPDLIDVPARTVER